MKPTSLSPEFYKKLYDEIICKFDFDPEDTEDTSRYIDAEDFEGYYIEFKATFEVNVVDDSFDHAFGTEHYAYLEVGELSDIDEVTMYDEDGNNVSKLFDHDAFMEQFKSYEVKLYSGAVIRSGDTILANYNGYRWEEVEFIHKNTLSGLYVCRPVGSQRYKYPRAYSSVLPATKKNRSSLLKH